MNFNYMVKFQLKLIFKTPVMLLCYFVYPPLLTLIIGYLGKDNFGGGFSSYEFYSISMLVFIYIGAGLISIYNFMDKHIKDGNLRTIFTPIKTSTIYLSQITSGTIFSAIGVMLNLMVFRFLFNINYGGSGFMIFISIVALSFMSNALGIFICTVNDDVLVGNMIFNFIQGFLGVLGGAFFSLEALGKIPAMLSKISPVKWIMDGLLNSIYDNNNFILYIVLLSNIALGGVLILICRRTFKTEKYL